MWWGWWCAVLSLVLGLYARPAAAAAPARVPASILIDALTGASLREQDADLPQPLGSLSQLIVLLLSMEEARLGAVPLDAPVTVSRRAAGPTDAGTTTAPTGAAGISLRTDKAYRLSDLLKVAVISSADDAAIAVAEAIAGSVPACLELMNARAQRLGMEATRYSRIGAGQASPSSMPDTTTARDLARLAQALVRHPQVLQWTSLSGLPFDEGSILLRNINQLLGTVPGVDGLQISSDRVAGYSIVATAQRGALRLIAVVLHAPDSATRYGKAADLLEWGFAQYERLEIVKKGEPLNLPIRIVNGSVSQLIPVAGKTFSLLRRRDEERQLEVRYQLPTVLRAPLKRHQPIGEVIVEEKGQLMAVIPIVSPSRVLATGVLSAALP